LELGKLLKFIRDRNRRDQDVVPATLTPHSKELTMQKTKLDIERIEVVSFETESCEGNAVAAITGNACITRPTVYGTCCTP
jgi:hypothetical protein